MWIFFAFGSAFFAGITAILAKCGIRKTDSDVATAVRTIVVLIFAWIMVWIAGSVHDITALSAKTWVFLVLSGLRQGRHGYAITKRCRTDLPAPEYRSTS